MNRPFLIGASRVDPSTHRVTVGGACHRLEPKAIAVLCELAQRPGEVFSRAELLEAVWPGTFVSDGVLTRAIHLLRQTFHDDPRTPRVIETVARNGYRLIAEVESEAPAPLAFPTDPVAVRRRPLVGRAKEQAILEHALERATAGHGSLLLVSGEPGIGKTRLTEELAATARSRGAVAFRGHCLRAEGAPPYAPWIEILERLLLSAGPAALRDLLGDGASEIAKLMPELRSRIRDLGPPLVLPPLEGRRYLFRCISGLVERSCRPQPLLLVLEDLHWADEATLQLLGHLAPQIGAWPVLLAVTYRDTDLDLAGPLAEVLSRFVRERLAERVALSRLPRDGVAAMLDSLAGLPSPPAVLEEIYLETEGNPFFVEEVFFHLREDGRLFDTEGAWREKVSIGETDVPENTRLVLARRVERLGEVGRQALTVAAVIGRRFGFELLLEASSLDRDDLLDVVDEAQRRGLIAPASSSDQPTGDLVFSHELIRQTLIAGISPPRRQVLHLRVANAIEVRAKNELDRHLPALAHHLFHAGNQADRDKTASFLMRAGDQSLERLAFSEAIHDFDRALSLIAAGSTEELQIRRNRGLAWRGLGEWPQAVDDWTAALPLAETAGDRDSVIRLCRDIGYLLIWQGRRAEVSAVIQRGLSRLGSDPSADRCRLLAIGAWAGGPGSMIRDALAMAKALDDPQVHGEALVASAWMHLSRMQVPEQAKAALRASELLRETGDAWRLADALAYFQTASSRLGDLAAIQRFADEAESLALRLGHPGALTNSLRASGHRRWMASGDLDDYESAGKRCAEICARTSVPLDSMYAAWLAQVDFWRGRWEIARERALAATPPVNPAAAHNGYEWSMLFLCDTYLGRPRSALRRLEEARGLVPRHGRRNWVGSYEMLFGTIEGLAMLGERELTAELYPLVQDALATGTVVSWDSRRLLQTVAGIAASADRKWHVAERHFKTALRQADEIPFKSEQSEARRFYAAMLIDRNRKGDRERAAELLDRAEQGYRELGMPRHLAIAKELAARL